MNISIENIKLIARSFKIKWNIALIIWLAGYGAELISLFIGVILFVTGIATGSNESLTVGAVIGIVFFAVSGFFMFATTIAAFVFLIITKVVLNKLNVNVRLLDTQVYSKTDASMVIDGTNTLYVWFWVTFAIGWFFYFPWIATFIIGFVLFFKSRSVYNAIDRLSVELGYESIKKQEDKVKETQEEEKRKQKEEDKAEADRRRNERLELLIANQVANNQGVNEQQVVTVSKDATENQPEEKPKEDLVRINYKGEVKMITRSQYERLKSQNAAREQAAAQAKTEAKEGIAEAEADKAEEQK